jgi:CubicO group peptidase (beta-lactamase class C family)
MKGRPRRWIAWLLLCIAAAGCSTAPKRPGSLARGDYAYTKERISWLVRKEMRKNDVTGLSLALVEDQRVIWAEGFGYADRANHVPATPETVYRVGSISKLLTATAAMQLSEQGRFDIDLPLQGFLPEFSIRRRFPESGPVTPRGIMTHHSGLPSDLLKGMWTGHPEPFANVVHRVRDEYAANPPGTVFSYSNLGVTLLGHALEKAAGRDFASHMEAALLRPLGMTRSTFSTGPDGSYLASRAYEKGEEAEETPLRDVPAGGLNSNVLDLSRFLQMVFAGGATGERQIVRGETLSEMLRPQNADVPLDLNFRVGLGWMLSGLGTIDIRNAGPVAHHGGATLYHRSQLIILPDHKLGVVVLANSSTAGSVVNKVATETLKLALEAKTGIVQPRRMKSAGREEPVPQDTLEPYEGRYATMAGLVTVRKASYGLRAEVMNRTLRLVPRSDGMLGVRYKFLGIFPVSLGDLDHVGIARDKIAGRDILKARLDGREMLIGQRIRPVPIPGRWLERLGFSMPLFFKGTLSFAVEPVSDVEAVIRGLGRGMGETIWVDAAAGRERISYSGYLLEKAGP